MRTAEVELNKKITFMGNDQEHKQFKLACVERGEEMGAVMRQLMRDYVAKHKQEGKR